jgi:hypothetical protein
VLEFVKEFERLFFALAADGSYLGGRLQALPVTGAVLEGRFQVFVGYL